MKILLCPDKFKGSLSALEVCNAIKLGIEKETKNHTIVICPMADGGDGSIEILKNYMALSEVKIQAHDPLMRKITTSYYHHKDIAYIELASSSGLSLLLDSERDCNKMTTYGTGEAIKEAIESGASEINLFFGGSASNDGGIGIAQALGYNFLDNNGNSLPPIGESLIKIKKIEDSQMVFNREAVELKIICDVDNPFHGKNGAAHVYALQKGASSEEVEILDKGLKNLADNLIEHGYKDISMVPGAGAAGGVGGGCMALLGGKLISGSQAFVEMADIETKIGKADVVITGEGQVDQQSFMGKVVGTIIDLCKKSDKPVFIITGSNTMEEEIENVPVFEVRSKALSLSDAMENAGSYIGKIGKEIDKHLKKMTNNSKENIIQETEESLIAAGFHFERMEHNRPWGAFWVIAEEDQKQFLEKYFPEEKERFVNSTQKISPKILLVAPQKRLSWQYHHRRSELWKVIEGKVGVVRSETDKEGGLIEYGVGDTIQLACGERHRLVGLSDYGKVAEIWVHEDAKNPSDEDDIVRLQDDFSRK